MGCCSQPETRTRVTNEGRNAASLSAKCRKRRWWRYGIVTRDGLQVAPFPWQQSSKMACTTPVL